MNTAVRGLDEWVARLDVAGIPVLKRTVRDIARLQADAENSEVRDVVEVLSHDPLMTLILLRYLQQHKRSSQLNEVVRIEQVLMMLGLHTFFTQVAPQGIVEEHLKGKLFALTGLLHAVKRATRAAWYARDWAVRLKDLRFDEIRMVALMHNFAEILMWCHAPEEMARIHALQMQDRTRRTREVQREVLGFRIAELQLELARRWQLPELLIDFMQQNYAQEKRMRTIVLAINLSRHAENGWNDAALPDDYRDIGELLHMTEEEAMIMVQGPQVTVPMH